MPGQSNYSQLLNALHKLMLSGQSGALCAKTDDEHAVHIFLKQGNIVDLRFGLKRGWASIPLIRDINHCGFHFDTMSPGDVVVLPGLPSTDEIMRLIGFGEMATPAPSPPEARPATPVKKTLDSTKTIDILQKLLQNRIGPIAGMLCEMVVNDAGAIDSPERLDQVLDDLAEEIGDADDAARFKEEAREQLLRMLL